MRVWLRFSYPGEHLWEELTGSTSVDVFAPWSKSCFQDPCPLWQPTDVAVHARLQFGNGKQLVQAVLFPKLPVSLEAFCPLLFPVNTAAGELFKQHLFSWLWETWDHHKAFQSSVPSSGWISPAAMPIILGQGKWFQVEAMPEPPVWMVLTPKQGWMSRCQQSLCWNSSSVWHWWLWTWGDSLSFPLHTRKGQHKLCKPQWENTSLF